MTGTDALLIAGALALAFVLVGFVELGVDILCRRRGLPTAGHCEHCPQVDTVVEQARDLGEQLTSLCDIARDQLTVLEAICEAVEQQAAGGPIESAMSGDDAVPPLMPQPYVSPSGPPKAI